MRRVEVRASGPLNSMWTWYRSAGPVRAGFNFAVIYLGRFVPWLPLKNSLYRLTGMKIGRNVSIGLMAMFDVLFPHLISIGDNSVIGYNATVLAHEFMVDQWRTGRVEIGKSVLIGTNSLVLPGVRIGDGAVVAAMSLVNRDVPAGARVGGVPARELPGPGAIGPGAIRGPA